MLSHETMYSSLTCFKAMTKEEMMGPPRIILCSAYRNIFLLETARLPNN